jgi:multiple sugar transport system ATP-binding protein
VVTVATEDLTKVYDTGTVAVDRLTFEVADGEFVVLLGPTGCGKSTVLRVIAGLERATSGHVRLDGQLVDDQPIKDRGLAMVFQDLALYPHLNVAENIAFPLRMARTEDARIAVRVAEVAQHLSIADLLDRNPAQLSGGQRQRVATARAIVREPRAFLLDEPLSNLDAGLRAELRTEIAELARGLRVTTLYVTHDQSEAMTMADRVAVLRLGKLQQIGTPEEVYGNPATVFVAAFLGTPRTNLWQGAVYAEPGRRVVLDLGTQVLALGWSDPRAAALAHHHTERLTVALRADAFTAVPAESPSALLRGTVRAVEMLGHEMLVHLDTGSVPTSPEQSLLEVPDVGTRARLRPGHHQETRPSTARTEYGFYPTYDPEPDQEASSLGDLVVRLPGQSPPRRGETVSLAVDLDRLMLFDRAGDRITLARSG